jgi:hypothetical protein
MGRGFKEVAHTRTNMDLYGPNHDHIFGKKDKPKEEECLVQTDSEKPTENTENQSEDPEQTPPNP